MITTNIRSQYIISTTARGYRTNNQSPLGIWVRKKKKKQEKLGQREYSCMQHQPARQEANYCFLCFAPSFPPVFPGFQSKYSRDWHIKQDLHFSLSLAVQLDHLLKNNTNTLFSLRTPVNSYSLVKTLLWNVFTLSWQQMIRMFFFKSNVL